MHIERLKTWQEMESLHDRWNALAQDIPFRRWEWLATWWKHFQAERQLFVLTATDNLGVIRGIAPFYLSQHSVHGRTLSFLGSGEVCSEYLSLLAEPQDLPLVAAAIAQWLSQVAAQESEHAWDLLHLDAVESTDAGIRELAARLTSNDCTLHEEPAMECWRIELPASWDEYLSGLQKPRRHKMRKALRDASAENIQRHFAKDPGSFERGWRHFVELHQRRWIDRGGAGCFACPRFHDFLQEAAGQFLQLGRLDLTWLEEAGQPFAALLALEGNETTYVYQLGIDPASLPKSPGWMVNSLSILDCIQAGQTAVDFLRGDEAYKAQIGAKPVATTVLRIVPPQLGSRLRHAAWLTGATMKNWVKSGLVFTGLR